MATHVKPELRLLLSPVRTSNEHDVQEKERLRLSVWAKSSIERATIHCSGEIIYRREADYLLDRVVEFDQRQVVIDLEHVKSVDAYGLGRLLAIQQTLEDRQQRLRLANPSERLQLLFSLTKLDFCFMCACGRMLH
jgi:anti-anti-sigma factor